MKVAVANTIKQTEIMDGRSAGDTIRIWESYKDQALFWRAIALLQIPATCIALIFALITWWTRKVEINVPQKPLPGIYAAREIPDTEFMDMATDYINFVATYQPYNAKRQFTEARKMLVEPLLSEFNIKILDAELSAIEGTNRTQLFWVDPTLNQIKREDNKVTVSMTGERQKIIAGKELPVLLTTYTITMTTIPRNGLNQYGIVITDVGVKDVKKGEIKNELEKSAKEAAMERRNL